MKKLFIAALMAVLLGGGLTAGTAEAYTWKPSNTYSSGSTYRTGYTAPANSSELRYGSIGTKVAEVQTYLRTLGYDLGTENGRYGYNTLQAVMNFQNCNGLPVTGRMDNTTYTVLKNAAGKPVVPAPTPQPTPEPAPAPTPTPAPAPVDQGLTAEEQQMLNLVNSERAKNGLNPLAVDMTLVKLARMKSQDMITNNYFNHTSPTYGSPFTMMANYGVTYRTAGENLAGAGSVSSAHTNLMNSSGHRANILNAAYTHIGIGIVNGGPYGKMFTQMFVGR